MLTAFLSIFLAIHLLLTDNNEETNNEPPAIELPNDPLILDDPPMSSNEMLTHVFTDVLNNMPSPPIIQKKDFGTLDYYTTMTLLEQLVQNESVCEQITMKYIPDLIKFSSFPSHLADYVEKRFTVSEMTENYYVKTLFGEVRRFTCHFI